MLTIVTGRITVAIGSKRGAPLIALAVIELIASLALISLALKYQGKLNPTLISQMAIIIGGIDLGILLFYGILVIPEFLDP